MGLRLVWLDEVSTLERCGVPGVLDLRLSGAKFPFGPRLSLLVLSSLMVLLTTKRKVRSHPQNC